MDIRGTILDHRSRNSAQTREKLSNTPRAEIESILKQWLNSWLDVDYIDWEELMYVGTHLQPVKDLDQLVHNWLWQDDDPSDERIAIATATFEGYWGGQKRGTLVPSSPAINKLLALIDRCSQKVLLGILIVLHNAIYYGDLDENLRDQIKQKLIDELKKLEQSGTSSYVSLLLEALNRQNYRQK